MNIRDFQTIKARQEAVEKEIKIVLPQISSFTKDLEIASTKNCENMIGSTQIPLGIAGPLKILSSDFGIRNYYLPLATTEGALVASVSRGCKAINESGGAYAHTSNVGVSRGPVFYTGSIAKSNKLYAWIKAHEKEMKEVAEATSSHLVYKKVSVKSLTDHVFVRFSFDTSDAMGMNMATIATQAIVDLIEKETGIACLSVAGNFDIDKKPAWLNMIAKRGHEVWAEATISRSIIEKVLKTTAQSIYDVWLGKCMLGSAMSGSLGFNAQYANIVASLFIATGQDPAHVVEGSSGITTARTLENGDLYLSVFLPSVMVGTVGGGTNLPTQREALQILGISGEGHVDEFACIVGAACLAGELSLLASLSEGTLARSHKKLGRAK